MKAYLSLIRIDLKLAFRNRSVIFFNYLFPLMFFFIFAQMMGEVVPISYVVGMVLVLGILGNGLFGAGMRAVNEREQNILRRYKVAPITPTPLLVSSMITGWVAFMPSAILIFTIAHFRYKMTFPMHMLSLFGLISLGVITFRSIGLIIASVVNSMQEGNILIQLLYMPMLFLSGATFPVERLPRWGQIVSHFLPASHLVTGFRGIFEENQTLFQIWPSLLALVATLTIATFVATQLFRWEKEEKIRTSAKLWVLAALAPFLILGCYQIFHG